MDSVNKVTVGIWDMLRGSYATGQSLYHHVGNGKTVKDGFAHFGNVVSTCAKTDGDHMDAYIKCLERQRDNPPPPPSQQKPLVRDVDPLNEQDDLTKRGDPTN